MLEKTKINGEAFILVPEEKWDEIWAILSKIEGVGE